MEKVSKDKQGDYVSRAYFWKGWCARKWNESSKLTKARSDLFSVNPLGFHTIALHEKKSDVIKKSTTKEWDKEPTIRFRTEKMPTLNAWVRAIEAIEQVGNRANVNHLLSVVRMRAGFLDTIEPEFRVYLAVLASRNQDTISLFRILDGLFRSDIQTVSGPLMKLFYPLKYEGHLKTYATQIDPLLVAALIRQESGYNEMAQSRVGARGLMQLMPYTAKKLKKVTIKQLFDPKINIELGVKYITMLFERFEGDIELALAGYNAGPEKVDSWSQRYPTDNRMLFLDLMPYKETRNYVALIGRNYYWYDYLYKTSFGENRKKTDFNALSLRN
jgi:soluble lytic murein transglycosylase